MISESSRVGVVTLRVTKLEEALKFYTEIIGLTVLHTDKNIASLGVGDTVLVKLVGGAEQKRERGTTGLYHFAILVPTRADLGTVLKHIVDSNYPLQGGADHIFSEAVYLQDPDGNGIEIYRDRPKEKWKVDAKGEFPLVSDQLDTEAILSEAKSWAGLPLGTTIGHIHLHVDDLEAAEAFYIGEIGLDKTIHIPKQALFVAAGGYHHHIGLNTWAGQGASRPSEYAAGLIEFEILTNEVNLEEQMMIDPSGNRLLLK